METPRMNVAHQQNLKTQNHWVSITCDCSLYSYHREMAKTNVDSPIRAAKRLQRLRQDEMSDENYSKTGANLFASINTPTSILLKTAYLSVAYPKSVTPMACLCNLIFCKLAQLCQYCNTKNMSMQTVGGQKYSSVDYATSFDNTEFDWVIQMAQRLLSLVKINFAYSCGRILIIGFSNTFKVACDGNHFLKQLPCGAYIYFLRANWYGLKTFVYQKQPRSRPLLLL